MTIQMTAAEKKEYFLSLRNEARLMYWRGYTCAEIARRLDIHYNTVRSWFEMDKWESSTIAERVNAQIEVRYAQLIAKEEKSTQDYNEIEMLAKQLERAARLNKYEETKNEADINPKIKERSKKRKEKQKEKETQGVLSEDNIAKLYAYFHKVMYPHQLHWYENRKHPLRQIVKSRQIGATFYFATEALLEALETGKNQIFLSASRNQVNIFRTNIIAFVEQATGVTLKGQNLKLSANTTLYFLSTNSNTAQSYSGDLYVDEYFWIPSFGKIQHVASGMAVHDDRRITYFSTPSTVAHEAYPLWSGEHYNAQRPKREHIKLNLSHDALKDGRVCEDGYWRQIVTIEDAVNSGFDRVTLEKLKHKFPNQQQFANLFMGEFVNDMNSLFKLKELQRCMVDARTLWEDWNPLAKRPLKEQPVWIGYDPSRSQDNSSLAVVAPPQVSGGDFRIIETLSFTGLNFEEQANHIKRCVERYNVQFIGIDATGLGKAVHDLVVKFYPKAKAIIYNVDEKNEMVLRAYQLISHGRLKFDAEKSDIASAFLTIHQAPTTSGKQVTYKASRTAKTGHADVAWAIMNALSKDPLGVIADAGTSKGRSRLRLF